MACVVLVAAPPVRISTVCGANGKGASRDLYMAEIPLIVSR